jgi:hypothetical protein
VRGDQAIGVSEPRYEKETATKKRGTMKALTTQIAETKAWLTENKKCVVADFSPLTFFRENGELDEEKTLSAIKKYASDKGFKESVEIRESGISVKANRRKGTNIFESADGRTFRKDGDNFVEFTESSRPRIKRNNGSGIGEAATEDRVQRAMRLHKMNFREATIFCGDKDPGPNAKTPTAFTESLVKAWKDYCGGLISEADAHNLAERGISPE